MRIWFTMCWSPGSERKRTGAVCTAIAASAMARAADGQGRGEIDDERHEGGGIATGADHRDTGGRRRRRVSRDGAAHEHLSAQAGGEESLPAPRRGERRDDGRRALGNELGPP